jgi:hypothetical protein
MMWIFPGDGFVKMNNSVAPGYTLAEKFGK